MAGPAYVMAATSNERDSTNEVIFLICLRNMVSPSISAYCCSFRVGFKMSDLLKPNHSAM